MIEHTVGLVNRYCDFIQKTAPDSTYTLGDGRAALKKSELEKDIGVIIDSTLNVEHHIATKVHKSNSILGVMHGTFQYQDERTLVTLYKSLVRLHLEIKNQVWAPHLVKHIVALENVRCTIS